MKQDFSSRKPCVMIVASSGGADVRISFNNSPFTTLEIFESGIRFFFSIIWVRNNLM